MKVGITGVCSQEIRNRYVLLYLFFYRPGFYFESISVCVTLYIFLVLSCLQ